MDLKIICIVLGIVELAFLVLCLACEFTIFHKGRSDSHFESKICELTQTLNINAFNWFNFIHIGPMFLMIETYVQYGIYLARVVLTSFLLYGLFTVSKTRFVLFCFGIFDIFSRDNYLLFVWLWVPSCCQEKILMICVSSTEKTSIFACLCYHDDFRLHILFFDVQCDALHKLWCSNPIFCDIL